MTISFPWITAVLLILSFAGYMLFVRRTMALPWEFIPLFVFSSIALIVFFCGLADQLRTGSLVVLGMGLLALIAAPFLRTGRSSSRRKPPYIYQLAFFAGSLLFLVVLFQNRLTHYDNFSHWAIVLKQMLSTNAFPGPDSPLIDFKNYPLGTSSFLYYVCRFAGHAQPVMLLAQGLLIFSCFYAMFGIISEKRRFLLSAFLGLGLSSLSFFNITIRISNLLVDFLLPIYTLAIFAVIHHYRDRLRMACLVVIPLAGLLTIIKSTGVIFAAIGLLYLAYAWLRSGGRAILRLAPAVIAALCGSMLPYFGWSWRMKTVFQGVENKFDVAAAGLQTGKTPEQMSEIISLFVSSATDLTTRPALGIAAFQVAAILVSLFAAFILKKKWNLWKALIALDLMVLLYYAGILGLYLFSMPLDEAIILAGFERYASSIVVLFAGGLVLCATVDIERSFHYKLGEVPDHRAFKSVRNKGYYQKGIWACLGIAVTLLLSEFNGMQSIAREYKTTLPYKVQQVTGDRWYDDGQVDQSRYLFYSSDANMQVTNYYLQYIGRYFLYAPNVDGIVLFYEDNMDNLLSGYDYFVVIESDPDGNRLLKKHYGVEMREGIYKIIRSGERIELAVQ